MQLEPAPEPHDKLERTLRRFALYGLGCSLVALFILWPLGFVGMGCGIRAIMLSYDASVKRKQAGMRYRVMGIVAVVLGILDVAGGLAGPQ